MQDTYRPDIDGLRAIAVAAAVGFHAFPAAFPGGFIGVDVFFVISGYLISRHIIGDLADDRFSFADFYARRIRRIFPALCIVLAVSGAAGWFIMLAAEYSQLGKHVSGGAGFVANLVFWNDTNYFDARSDRKPLLHLWSLGIEEQFYLVWPILLYLASRWRPAMLPMLLLVAGWSFTVGVRAIGHDPVGAFYSPLGRFWELLAGAWLAYASVYGAWHRGARPPGTAWAARVESGFAALCAWSTRAGNLLAIPGIALLAGGLFLLDDSLAYPGYWVLVPTLGTAFLIAAGPDALPNRLLLASRPFIFLGLVSYPLYLWHWPILSFLRILGGGRAEGLVALLAVAASVVLAWLTYGWVERPVRSGRLGRAAVPLLCAVLLALGLAGYGAYQAGGLPGRAVQEANALLATATEEPDRTHVADDCSVEPTERFLVTLCHRDTREPPTLAVWGDSKGEALFWGLVAASPAGARWYDFGNAGCTALAGVHMLKPYAWFVDSRWCADGNGRTLARLTADQGIRTVVMVMSERGLVRYRYARDGGDDYDPDGALLGLTRAAEALLGAGKRVILFVDHPEFPDPRDCLEQRPFVVPFIGVVGSTRLRPACTQDLAEHRRLTADFRVLLDRFSAAVPGAEIYDPAGVLCTGEPATCPAVRDGRFLYHDGNHLSQTGAVMVARDLLQRLGAAGPNPSASAPPPSAPLETAGEPP